MRFQDRLVRHLYYVVPRVILVEEHTARVFRKCSFISAAGSNEANVHRPVVHMHCNRKMSHGF